MKRPTKAQREASELQGIERRLLDIAYGAHGDYAPILGASDSDFQGVASELGIEAFGRFIGGIRNVFFAEDRDSWMLRAGQLHKFDSIKVAAKYLHDHCKGGA